MRIQSPPRSAYPDSIIAIFLQRASEGTAFLSRWLPLLVLSSCNNHWDAESEYLRSDFEIGKAGENCLRSRFTLGEFWWVLL